jgi:hydrogenase large subunit
MRAFNPFTGEIYREGLKMSRVTREMFCLMEGRHVHPSTLYPGGVGTVPTHQLLTDYLVRLMSYLDFVKKIVPLNDDVFDFYEALPGYEEVGRRRVLLGCWGAFQDPEVCDFNYKTMPEWGRAMFVTPVSSWTASWSPRTWSISTSASEFFWAVPTTTTGRPRKRLLRAIPGKPRGQATSWNQTTTPMPQKRDFGANYSWVMSPRWFDKRSGDHLSIDTGGGPIARLWSTALANLVDVGYVKSTGHSVEINLPKTALMPETHFEWKIPKWSNALERDRARIYFIAYSAAMAFHFLDKAFEHIRQGDTKVFTEFTVPDEAIGCGFHEAVRGVLSHHLVIRDGKIANYHPYPPTPWNASPRDTYGTPGRTRTRCKAPDLRGERPRQLQGIDIMRTVRSFDPCLPCGVHMYLGDGKTLKVNHSPTLGLGV